MRELCNEWHPYGSGNFYMLQRFEMLKSMSQTFELNSSVLVFRRCNTCLFHRFAYLPDQACQCQYNLNAKQDTLTYCTHEVTDRIAKGPPSSFKFSLSCQCVVIFLSKLLENPDQARMRPGKDALNEAQSYGGRVTCLVKLDISCTL